MQRRTQMERGCLYAPRHVPTCRIRGSELESVMYDLLRFHLSLSAVHLTAEGGQVNGGKGCAARDAYLDNKRETPPGKPEASSQVLVRIIHRTIADFARGLSSLQD